MDLSTIKAYEAKAKDILDHAIAFVKQADGNAAVQKLADEIPAVRHLLDKVLSAVPVVGQAEAIVDGLITAYALAEFFGMRPMDANQMAEDDKKFHPGMSQD